MTRGLILLSLVVGFLACDPKPAADVTNPPAESTKWDSTSDTASKARPSGVPPSPSTTVTATAAVPGRVVVRKMNGASGRAYVRCLPGERLMGGGCGGDGCRHMDESYPNWYGPDDSEGAGWVCSCGATGTPGVGPTAFALCEKMPAP